jgi:O-antigen/teichoic acid export membrane protein
MAVVGVFQAAVRMSTDFGVGQSVIRSRSGDDPSFLQTAWTFNIVKSVAMYLAVLLVAGALLLAQGSWELGDTIYADPLLPALLIVSSLSILISGLGSMNTALSERKLRVGRMTTIGLSSRVVGLCVMIVSAWLNPSVWALVHGNLAAVALSSLLSHIALPGPRMRLAWVPEHVREIWGFGKWLVGSSIATFASNNGDRLILAAFLAPLEFSLYAIARIWIDTGISMVRRASRPVSYAAFGEVSRERPEALWRAFKKVRLVQNAACVAAFLAFLLGGPVMIHFLYTAEYAPVGPLMAILAPLVLFNIYQPIGALLLSSGNSRNAAFVSTVRAVTMLTLLPLALAFLSPAWAFLVIVINPAFGTVGQIILASRIVPLSTRREFAILAGVVTISAAIALGLGMTWSPGG